MRYLLFSLLAVTLPLLSPAQTADEAALYQLIDQYSQARADRDATLLDEILTEEVDQLVSSGTWRRGKEEAMAGMLRSSTRNPGKRTLTVDRIRFLHPTTVIIDARYEIESANGSVRKMWSTFIAIRDQKTWKIAGIRNMKPAG